MLELPRSMVDELTVLAYDAYPYECCALIAGPPDSADVTTGLGGAEGTAGLGGDQVTGGLGGAQVARLYPCRNAAESARVYTVDPHDHLRAERDAEANGWEIVGVVHSHTHTEPYPSPTDVAQAPDPAWHYVIVSLKRESPEIRSYRIVDGIVTEEPLGIV